MKDLVIHIAEAKDFSDEVMKKLRGFATLKTDFVEQSKVKEALEMCDVFWFRLGFRIGDESLSGAVRCRFIVCPVTGLDHIDLQACDRAGIKVLSLRGETDFLKNVRATAEHTIGLTLSLLRHSSEAIQHVKAGYWNRDLFKGNELFGKTVGILGVGRLGTLTAGYFKAFGAHVIGYDKNPFDPTICERAESGQVLFEKSDVLSIHLSYDESTHHFVTRDSLKLMRPHAILINTARGGIINSEDLIWALENNVIAGAALDVIEDEHYPQNNVLIAYSRSHSNLIITPHIGGNTYESFEKTEFFLAEKLMASLDHE